ncbi:ABC-type dipeptide transport system, periplasmic component [Candidatus Scalindua japonica]|uniref:ABC-type dipeptide transport system, periplasmic component n=1 Tax=Candidatus Scalindua japonica TaxID=1284222 RepID=A0A286U2D8_9BACT|nr:PEP-CTERM sorting domain-containing protein [Candidatus Scalindua japonica]GAX62292.1 ABC-type dipeptide transport system, periplasmic component [Candidatus Scalindua japonica]
MKKGLLIAAMALGLGVGSMCVELNRAEAAVSAVQLDVVDLMDWGRSYDYDLGTNTYTPAAGSDNPWNPGGVNNPGVSMVADTFGNHDGTEDTWGIAQIDQITNTAGTISLFDKDLSNFELTMFFWGFDDDIITAPNVLGNSNIGAVGGRVQVWKDFAQDFDPTIGTAGRTGGSTFTTATEGELVLDLIPHAFANGTTLNANFNFISNTGSGVVYLDTSGAGSWDAFYDTDSQLMGSDFLFQWTVENNAQGDTVADWTVRGDGRQEAALVPEATTVALLGIGLVGMAGVAVRKKLKKNVERS